MLNLENIFWSTDRRGAAAVKVRQAGFRFELPPWQDDIVSTGGGPAVQGDRLRQVSQP